MRLRWLFGILVVVVMIGPVGNASAKMMGGGMGMDGGGGKAKENSGMMDGKGGEGHFLHLVHALDLTDEQHKAMEAIHFSHWKEVVRKEADLKVAEIELREVLAQETVKVSDAEKKIRAIADFRADLEIIHLREREAVKAILTPEQLEKLNKQLREERHEKMIGKGGMDKHESKKGCKSSTEDSGDKDDDGGGTGHEAESKDHARESKGH